VQVRGPVRGRRDGGGVVRQVQAPVDVGREPGERGSLLGDALLDEATGTLAEVEVLGPEPVQPAGGIEA